MTIVQQNKSSGSASAGSLILPGLKSQVLTMPAAATLTVSTTRYDMTPTQSLKVERDCLVVSTSASRYGSTVYEGSIISSNDTNLKATLDALTDDDFYIPDGFTGYVRYYCIATDSADRVVRSTLTSRSTSAIDIYIQFNFSDGAYTGYTNTAIPGASGTYLHFYILAVSVTSLSG